MKSIVFSGVFAAIVLSVAGAPTFEGEQPRYVNKQQVEEFLRERRAPYLPTYVSPCASASTVQVPVSSVPVAAFSAPSYQGYAAVPQYGYGSPHYRTVDEAESELLGFSDMDTHGHVPMARLGGYGNSGISGISGISGLSAGALSAGGSRVLTQATSGTALGVFPNANVGGCSVPLLFSCSPTIVPGHIVESQAHGASAYSGAAAIGTSGASSSGDSYRLVDEPAQHEQHEQQELLTHEHMSQDSTHATHQ
ncbi:hypothetical protein PYW07_003747 [Mythimna separata]|uniref:Uncharacterized protein n=1 Tax=Mythimna separata TaxID=271217 RepID=A0AAD7YQ73_MYTSE|nr:hypothetical protein PYW07_003747 [Mythimna separata]